MDELIAELKTRRETMGLSLQDMFRKTRINITFLEALEAGNFEILPDAYVKLFLKRYAQEVKLDGDEIVRRFEKLHWKATAASQPPPQRSSEGLPGWAIGFGAAVVLAAGVGLFVTLSEEEESRPSFSSSAPSSRDVSAIKPAVSPTKLAVSPTKPAVSPTARAANEVRPTTQSPPAASADASGSSASRTAANTDHASPTGTSEMLETATQEGTGNSIEPPVSEDPFPPTQSPEPEAPLSEETPADLIPSTVPEPSLAELLPPPAVEILAPEAAETDPDPAKEKVVSAYSLSLKTDLSTTPGPLSLIATGLEGTQVTVTSDGEPVFNAQVNAGRRIAWEARDRFSIEIQNGAGVSLRLQEENLPPFATAGRKVRLYISRSSIWIEEVEPASQPQGDTERP